MRLKELRGLPVIDPTAARKIGTVTDYQVDPTVGRLAALDVSAVDNGDPERIMAERIRRVGRHAVILTGRGGAATSVAPELNERWLDNSTLVGLEVLGDDGDRVGHLVDARFDQDSLDIEAYVLRSSFIQRFTGRRGRILPTGVHSCSRELMMVTTGRVKEVAAPSEETLPLGVPLKAEDRLPVPTYTPVENGQAVGARAD